MNLVNATELNTTELNTTATKMVNTTNFVLYFTHNKIF